ncbi:hypothetical protein NQ314_013197 [Rhamnusium bicolor]|uniref:DDE Tnp4 domain-containing protein n=1 Tax=Rhamnusium bicolor TaxID=1586634 RepID=A0AAV8X842_9CUCU|nr:hypothetical protein NQ314_013197 [Rhamnusium bicolor]
MPVTPFELLLPKFMKMYRLTPELALNFYRRIETFLEEPQRENIYSKLFKVSTSIHKVVIKPIRSVRVVSDIISTFVLNEYVKFPINNEDTQHIRARFFEKFNFLNVLGCVDGTYISIIQPPEDNPVSPGLVYLNRKGFYSINTQLICDADLRILAMNARFPRSTHNSTIWQMSNVRNVSENTPEGRYTKAHCRTRNTIERCIGVLKSRFKCLRKHRFFHYDLVAAANIIYSCGVLHNICIDANLDYEGEIIIEEHEIVNDVPDNDLPENLLRIARGIQKNVVQEFI